VINLIVKDTLLVYVTLHIQMVQKKLERIIQLVNRIRLIEIAPIPIVKALKALIEIASINIFPSQRRQ
jgi:hypothetical protein